MLRDVRPGVAAPPRAAASAPRPASPPPAESSRAEELFSLVLGKLVVIVPVAAILAFGLWTGYEGFAGENMSPLQAIVLSAGSLALTIGLAFVWASRRAGRH